MSQPKRLLAFSLAINEAIHQCMAEDPSVILIGQGVKSPWYVGNTATGLLERFGPRRVIDSPVSENAITGAAVGAAMAGSPTIVVHPRMDFMLYAFDPIINEAANFHYMSGGALTVPVVFWGIINRGGEQAAQHSQALHAMFAHVPGLKVVMPSTAHDAKGLMIAAVRDRNPVMFIDERWLYSSTEEVPEEPYEVPIGKAALRRRGTDVTVVSYGYMMKLALEAGTLLAKRGVKAEIIDLRSLKPWDADMVLRSVRKTGRLVVADGGWRTGSFAGEIAATVAEEAFDSLVAPIRRVTLPDAPAPAARSLEQVYYPKVEDIVGAVLSIMP